jgi:hypothetical protein
VKDFLREYWWYLSAVVFGAGFFTYQSRKAKRMPPRPSNARSFAAVRSFRPDELRPLFGVYSAGRNDLAFFVYQLLLFVGVTAAITFANLSHLLAIAATATAALGAFALLRAEWTSKRIVGPDVIAFVSPVRRLSWSVPLTSVIQCDLVPGSPHHRLRVHTDAGSFTLPLTADLAERLEALPASDPNGRMSR